MSNLAEKTIEKLKNAEKPVRKWYKNKFNLYLPKIDYIVLPKDSFENSNYNYNECISINCGDEVDMKFLGEKLRKAKQKVIKKYKRYFKTEEQKKEFKKFEEANIYTIEEDLSVENIPLNALMVPDHFSLDYEGQASAIICHEFFHLFQSESGIHKKHELIDECSAYYVSGKLFSNQRIKTLLNLFLDFFGERLRKRESDYEIFPEMLRTHLEMTGISTLDNILKDKPRKKRFELLKKEEFYNEAEDEIFYNYYKSCAKYLLGHFTGLNMLENFMINNHEILGLQVEDTDK